MTTSATMTVAPATNDWPQIFREIDRDVGAWTPESLRAAYVRHGCAVVRRAIDTGAIAKLRAVISDIYVRTNDVHVYDHEISDATRGALTGFELVGHPTLQKFLQLVFTGQRYERENATSRRIKAKGGDKDWQEPLSLHLDSYFHQFWFTVNFWVPFDECGAAAPGIQLLPIDYRATRGYCGFSKRPVFEERDGGLGNSRYFPWEEVSVDTLEHDFGRGCLIRPMMKPGDVVIASNWIIHGSYRTPDMTKGRGSIELRFVGTCPDIAVRPDRSDRYRIVAWFMANRLATKLRKPTKTGLPFWAERM